MRLIVVVITSAAMLCGFVPVSDCQETYHGRGFVPPSFAPHHVEASVPRTLLPLPLHFDWREAGCVTPVRNQGSCGACYAFAGLADLESKLLIAGEGTFDFSENNLKECEFFARNGFFPSGCNGGTYWRVINLMAEYGTVLETCDPYVPYNATCRLSCPYVKTVLNWRVFSLNYVPPVDVIKAYVHSRGPVFAAIDAGYRSAWANELDDYDGSYTLYYPEQYQVNHSVLIVGWDDTLSHEGGQGAWICKNSWGTSWGGTAGYGTERGYFTIAYGSANLGYYASFVDEWQDYDPCGRLLFYDEAGYYNQVTFGSVTAWGMCKFVLEDDALLQRVEFWTTDATTDVDVYVYDDFDGSGLSNLLGSELDNSYGEMGYHSVPLAPYVEAAAGEDVYVAVKFTNTAYTWPLTMDAAGVGPTAPGMCHISPDGGSWHEFDMGDLGIRLRIHLMRDCEPPDPVSFFTAQGGDRMVALRWTNPTGGDFSHVVIRYSTAGYPASTQDGIAVENGSGGVFSGMPGGVDTFIHTGLVRNETYYYSAFAADTVPNYSTASCAHATTERWTTWEVKTTDPEAPWVRNDMAESGAWHNHVPDGVEIRFLSEERGEAGLTIYDVAGRCLRTLTHTIQDPGHQRVIWDGTGDDGARVEPGVYFVRISAPDTIQTLKMAVLR